MQAEHNLNIIVCDCFTNFFVSIFFYSKILKNATQIENNTVQLFMSRIATWVDSDFCYTIISGLFSLTEF